MSIVDARFAGGPLHIENRPIPGLQSELVTLEGPGFGIDLTVLEARNLADAILKAANRASSARELHRPPHVDQALRDRDV